jgi:hypothetical protein
MDAAKLRLTFLVHPDDGSAKFLQNVGSYKSLWHNIPEDAIQYNMNFEFSVYNL